MSATSTSNNADGTTNHNFGFNNISPFKSTDSILAFPKELDSDMPTDDSESLNYIIFYTSNLFRDTNDNTKDTNGLSIILPIPNDGLTDTNDGNWENQKNNSIKQFGTSVNGAIDQFKKGDTAAQYADAILGLAQSWWKGGDVTESIRDLASSQRQITANPGLITVFRKMEAKSFSFAYTLIPRDIEEAKKIKIICDCFKIGSLPAKPTDNSGSTYLKYPPYWQITIHQDDGLFKIQTCFLKRVEVKYGADRYTEFQSTDSNFQGVPTAVSINLTFEQTKMQTMNDMDVKTIRDQLSDLKSKNAHISETDSKKITSTIDQFNKDSALASFNTDTAPKQGNTK